MLMLMEDAVNTLLTMIRERMPAKIDELNTEFAGDGIELEQVLEGSYFDAEQLTLENYPAIEVLGSTTRFETDTMSLLKTAHEVVISCTVMDDQDVSRLRRKVYRYARALVEVLREIRQDGHFISWGDPPIDFSPAFRNRNTSQVLADCLLNVTYRKAENPT